MAKATIIDGVRHSRTLLLAHTAAVTPGDVVVSGGQVLAAVSHADADAKSSFIYRARASLPKGSGAIAAGVAVYWDESAGQVTATSTDNTRCGIAIEAAASADAELVAYLHEN